MAVASVVDGAVVAAAAMLAGSTEADGEFCAREQRVKGREALPAREVEQNVEALSADFCDGLGG